MARKEKPQPYIGYGKAVFLTRIFDFINRANRMRQDVYTELDDMSHTLTIMQKQIREMKQAFAPLENPNARCTEYEDDIEALRALAWGAGLTRTLFEKLKDKDFQIRFTGNYGLRESPNPVLKEEIEDPCLADDESA
jgi:hypothetical protein